VERPTWFVFEPSALDAARDRGALTLAVDNGLIRDVAETRRWPRSPATNSTTPDP
jgi:hypothetical protein